MHRREETDHRGLTVDALGPGLRQSGVSTVRVDYAV